METYESLCAQRATAVAAERVRELDALIRQRETAAPKYPVTDCEIRFLEDTATVKGKKVPAHVILLRCWKADGNSFMARVQFKGTGTADADNYRAGGDDSAREALRRLVSPGLEALYIPESTAATDLVRAIRSDLQPHDVIEGACPRV